LKTGWVKKKWKRDFHFKTIILQTEIIISLDMPYLSLSEINLKHDFRFKTVILETEISFSLTSVLTPLQL